MKRRPVVISIAAVSGGGKTTITTELNKKLKRSKALYFDEYDFEESPDDLIDWVNRGPDYDEWNLTPLINDLQLLLHQNELDCILLDYPFAYLNSEMRPYIDLAIFVDTPLDIAMARRILRDFTQGSVDHVRNNLSHYERQGREAYLSMLRTVKPDSDLIIDGTLPPQLIIEKIQIELNNQDFIPSC